MLCSSFVLFVHFVQFFLEFFVLGSPGGVRMSREFHVGGDKDDRGL